MKLKQEREGRASKQNEIGQRTHEGAQGSFLDRTGNKELTGEDKRRNVKENQHSMHKNIKLKSMTKVARKRA